MLATLTDQELDQLEQHSLRGLHRLYDTATGMFTGLSQVTGDAEYQRTWCQAGDILNTAHDAHELHDDVIAERRARRERRHNIRSLVAASNPHLIAAT